MKLPNADKAIVEREKIVEYLLNPFHRHGAGKAQFLSRFGFRVDDWEKLAAALREHGAAQTVADVHETGHGPRYVVEGPLRTPAGRRPRIRSVWQRDHGEVAPRLITAYPLEE